MKVTKTGLLGLYCAGLLTACAAPAPQVSIKPPLPPGQLMDCPQAPEIPETTPLMETDIAFLLRDFFIAHQTCRSRLLALSGFVRETHREK